MRATTSQVTMQEYASDNTEYKSSPNDNQTAAGVVPLDTLPAAWWNWLWSMVTKNNNAIYLSIGDLRDEMLAVLTNAGLTPSDTVTNQLLQAIEIIRKRFPTTDAVSSDPVPGAVISSSDIKSVSVSETTGQMVVNALADWVGTDTVREFLTTMQAALMALVAPAFSETATYAIGDYVIYNDMLYRFSAAKEAGDWDTTKAEQMIVSNLLKEHTTKVDTAISTLTTQVDDAIATMEGTIDARAHVIALNVSVSGATDDTDIKLTATSRVDGKELSTYTPQPGDVVILYFSNSLVSYDYISYIELNINSATYIYDTSDPLYLDKVVVFTLQQGTMAFVTGHTPRPLLYVSTYAYSTSISDNNTLRVNMKSTVARQGDMIKIQVAMQSGGWVHAHYVFSGGSWYASDLWCEGISAPTIVNTAYTTGVTPLPGVATIYAGVLSQSGSTATLHLGPSKIGSESSVNLGGFVRITYHSSSPITFILSSMLNISWSNISANVTLYHFISCSNYTIQINRVGTASYLNNSASSISTKVTADVSGNLTAHTLALT